MGLPALALRLALVLMVPGSVLGLALCLGLLYETRLSAGALAWLGSRRLSWGGLEAAGCPPAGKIH